MSTTTTIHLPEHQTSFVKNQVALRAALIEGEESGPGEPFDAEGFLERMRAEHIAQR